MKRSLDLVLAVAIAPFALVICCLVAIPIMIEARASPWFAQTRLGKHEKPFKLLKLRTMHASTPDQASHKIGAKAVLVSGGWLRKFKIDEMPQIWNVLNGTMSFVGPRPGLPVQEDLTAARRQHGVFDLVPGITGTAQIRGIDMSTPAALAKADAQYQHSWSLSADLRILWATASGHGRGDAAEKAPSEH